MAVKGRRRMVFSRPFHEPIEELFALTRMIMASKSMTVVQGCKYNEAQFRPRHRHEVLQGVV